MSRLGWVALVLVLGGCSGGTAATTTTTTRATTTTTVATTTTTTTMPEPEPVRSLRAYFDAYATAVQTKNPDSILPYLDQDNAAIVSAVTGAIRGDINTGSDGTVTLSNAFVEFERVNDEGASIASVRATYSDETGAISESYGFIEIDSKWLLTAVLAEGFR